MSDSKSHLLGQAADSDWVCCRDTIPSGAYVCHYYGKVRTPVCPPPAHAHLHTLCGLTS